MAARLGCLAEAGGRPGVLWLGGCAGWPRRVGGRPGLSVAGRVGWLAAAGERGQLAGRGGWAGPAGSVAG